MSTIQHHQFDSGLRVITESIPGTKTVAVNWAVPSGVATNQHDGDSVLLAELVQRGVTALSAKEHNDALDSLGIRRQVSCGIEFFRVSSVMLGTHFVQGIPLIGAYLLSPELPRDGLDACKSLCLQSIQSLEDDPSHLVGVALNQYHFPAPFNRSAYGVAREIESATIDRLQEVHTESFVPDGSILVVAGDIHHDEVVASIGNIVCSWKGTQKRIETTEGTNRGIHWIQRDTNQVHLAFAFDGPRAEDENVLLEAVAISVFGGASSGRLFTQVRQRRSLCYSVSAQFAPARERSVIRMRAGTTPERAKETVDVCIHQLNELRNGITKEEFARTIQRMKSRTVMHGEATTARASALWGDQYAIGRTRSLAERVEEIDGITYEKVNNWLKNRDFGELTLAYVGPEDLELDANTLHL